MEHGQAELVGGKPVIFGQRKVRPRACVAVGKQHLRAFLRDVLEDIGFVISECGTADELPHVLCTELPDLILLGIGSDRIEPGRLLEILVREKFAGRVLSFGARESIVMTAVQQVGREYGLAMLPPLRTPFAAETLRDRVAMLLPREPAPRPAVHVGEALHAGWLELWYEPKFDACTLSRRGAEALVRMRHPTWGVVPPAYFIPEPHDPHFRELSQFVIDRAIMDWQYLLEQKTSIDLSINLPAAFLIDPQAVRDLCQRMPAHPAFGGLTIEIESEEAIRNLDLLIEVAREVRLYNIGLAIDNVGANWPQLMGVKRFPFRKLKVDRQYVSGCGNGPLKRRVCRQIVDLAKEYSARTVAEGVESHDDLIAVTELGFDLAQGHLFGKAMPLKQFAQSSFSTAPLLPK
ncbi:EAL domain-containing response regulator [Bradyrhizobium sp. SSUT18]|uniref:EAL domain-containing response regulator n=1 Tax=Bradyrhizobium sp. SSUT18 TaxID=3040602 RepID=UPI00244D2FD3|nr:EAL domain-containing response regulator [Bradyrhizobium sp. SSUT18]MDH2399084.1 EAL domain-containing response regulator [Bradyrhizobium sp. SSUT18]